MTSYQEFKSKTGIFDPLFQYFTTVMNVCSGNPDCDEAQEYAKCKYSHNRPAGSSDNDICPEFVRNVLAFGKHLRYYDRPAYEQTIIKPIEDRLVQLFEELVSNSLSTSMGDVSIASRIHFPPGSSARVEEIFREEMTKRADLSSQQKTSLNALKTNISNLVSTMSDSATGYVQLRAGSTNAFNTFTRENASKQAVGVAVSPDGILTITAGSGPQMPMFIMQPDAAPAAAGPGAPAPTPKTFANWWDTAKKNVIHEVNNISDPNSLLSILYRNVVKVAFENPARKTDYGLVKTALDAMKNGNLSTAERALLEKTVDVLRGTKKVENYSEINVDTDRINLRKENFSMPGDKTYTVPLLLTYLPRITNRDTKLWIGNKPVMVGNRDLLLRMLGTIANKSDDSTRELNSVLGANTVSNTDEWYTKPVDQLVFKTDMVRYIDTVLTKVEEEEDEMEGKTLTELANKFRNMNGELLVHDGGNWVRMDNSAYLNNPKNGQCYTTGFNGADCDTFIRTLLEGKANLASLKSMGPISSNDVKATHPKLALRLLKQLGFKRKRSKNGLWYVQSVEDLEKKGLLSGIDTNPRTYLNLLVQLVNSNDIYNNTNNVEEDGELSMSTQPLPQILAEKNYKRYVPLSSRKSARIDWVNLLKNPVGRLSMPSLSGYHASLGLGGPVISGFGAVPTFGSVGLRGGGQSDENLLPCVSEIHNMARRLIDKLTKSGYLSDNESGKLKHKLQEMNKLEIEIFNILNTYARFSNLIDSGITIPKGVKSRQTMEQLVNRWNGLMNKHSTQSQAVAELVNVLQDALNKDDGEDLPLL